MGSARRGIYLRVFGDGKEAISNGEVLCSFTEAHRIEGERARWSVKGAKLFGNGPETLREVTMLGHDLAVSEGFWTCGKDGQNIPVGVGCPTVKIAKITVSRTEIG
ncbi:MAG: hypothetical protein JW751_13450 [Polyangiaceae bacterium]|nr:hypothetical protein [Polyangiaceae bacterium]